MKAWEGLLRMLRIHRDPDPDDSNDHELTKARERVEQLHDQADTVLSDYAAANGLRRARRKS